MQPPGLDAGAGDSIRFVFIAVDWEELNGPLGKRVIPFISGEREIVQVRFIAVRIGDAVAPIVVTERRKEAVRGCASAIAANVWKNVIVVILAYVGVDCRSRARLIIV